MGHSKTHASRFGLAAAATLLLLAFCTAIACLTVIFSTTASAGAQQSFGLQPAQTGSVDHRSVDNQPEDRQTVDYRSAAYSDVGSSHRYAEAVTELSRRGCISGYDDGSFSPDGPITRQQFAKVLTLALGLAVSEEDVCPFPDVFVSGPDSLYPDNYVAVLAANGIVLGANAECFSPGAALRRSQADAMLLRGGRLVAPYVPVDMFQRLAGATAEMGLPVTRGEAVNAIYEFIATLESFPEPVEEGSITGLVRMIGWEESAGEDGPPGARVAGAVVTVQATDTTVGTDRAGRFEIKGLAGGIPVVVTAWAPGCFIGGSDPVLPGTGNLEIVLRPLPENDDQGYQWLSAYGTDPDSPNCQRCHSGAEPVAEEPTVQEPTVDLLPFDEWIADAHAGSARNPRFLTMYSGTDLEGNQSPLTRYIWDRDYGRRPLPPDPNLAYFGPGYQLDFPGTKGNCATCHVPVAALDDPYGVDPTTVSGVAAEGIGCDFCHKVWDAIVDPATGLPYENAPGVLSLEMRRPGSGSQFFAGPLADVAPGDDTFSALQKESLYCAPCHTARFWGTQIYDSYGEWLASPYSDPATGQTCQDCHMPSRGSSLIARPEVGGNLRSPETVRSHLMPGAADVELLQAALSMAAEARWDEGRVNVTVTVTNDKTGHHVPTDSPLRQVLLVVQAAGPDGQALERLVGPVLPDWAGVGADPDRGRYAGLSGTAYAKVLREPWTGVVPSGAYWNPTVIESDTRLAAFASDTTTYSFAAPTVGSAFVHVTLLYRRAFFELAEQKGWDLTDIVMAEQDIEVAAP